jgi:RND family efflux transporter MFP subunit
MRTTMIDRIRRALPLLSLAAAALSGGCAGSDESGPVAPPVTVATPEVRDVLNYGEYTGTTRAVASVVVRARVPGVLEEVRFAPAADIREDQVLFVIEQTQYEAARDQARAGVRSAEADLALAESNLERVRIAIETEAVSEQDLDRAEAEREAAEAAVLSARARLTDAERNYSYTLVRSPVAGQVGRNLVDVGNLVGAGEATALTTVNTLDPIYVYFNVPESGVLAYLEGRREMEAGHVDPETTEQVGKVFVGTANESGFPHEGRIDFIGNTVDPSTGTIELRGVLPNEDRSLFPGLFVRIRVPGRMRPDAVLVEEAAVGTDLGGKYVMVVDQGGVVEQRYVDLGQVQEDGTVVVLSGLEPEERYIVNGLLRARPGLPVTPLTREQAEEMERRQAGAVEGGS